MAQTNLVTLSAMAERLLISTKTLKKYIKRLDIPHFEIGRSIRLDPIVVESYFRAMPKEQAKVIQFNPVKRGKVKAKGRFAQAVGL